MSVLFLIPPKTLSQTDLNTWNTIVTPEDVMFTSISEDYDITTDYLNRLNCSVHTFENFNSSGIVEKKAIALHKKKPFIKIISTSEVDVLRSAVLRQYFNIPGQNIEEATLFRDKFKMKNLLIKKGIKTPYFKKICYATDLIQFIDEVNYDVVVKPNSGAGSADTTILRNERQLNKLLESNLLDSSYEPADFIAESFITSTMYHIDGLVLNGKIIINQPSVYINTCVDFQNGVYLGSYTLAEDNPLTARLKVLNQKVICAMPSPRNFAFHAEYFHTNADEIIFCEIACRPGGGAIKDVILEKYGVNIVTEWMKSEINPNYQFNQPVISSGLSGFLLVPPSQGILKSIPEEATHDWIKKYRVTAKINSKYLGHARTSGEIINIMISGNNETEMLDRVHTASSWIKNNLEWCELSA